MKKTIVTLLAAVVLNVFCHSAFGESPCGMPSDWIKDSVSSTKGGEKLYDWYYNPKITKIDGAKGEKILFFLGLIFTDSGREHFKLSLDSCGQMITLLLKPNTKEYRVFKYYIYDFAGHRIKESEEFPYGENLETPLLNTMHKRWVEVACDLYYK